MNDADYLLIKKAIECYELMDQTGLLRLKQTFESELTRCGCSEELVNFASIRIQLIDGILEEREQNEKGNGFQPYPFPFYRS